MAKERNGRHTGETATARMTLADRFTGVFSVWLWTKLAQSLSKGTPKATKALNQRYPTLKTISADRPNDGTPGSRAKSRALVASTPAHSVTTTRQETTKEERENIPILSNYAACQL